MDYRVTLGTGKPTTVVGEPTTQEKLKAAEARIAFLEKILTCPNCDAIMEDRQSCIFCGWKAEARAAELEQENARIKALIERAGGDMSSGFDWATIERIGELEDVLMMVEWAGLGIQLCPWCLMWKLDGHAPDCPRKKVLNAA